jgi:hypothetical protein
VTEPLPSVSIAEKSCDNGSVDEVELDDVELSVVVLEVVSDELLAVDVVEEDETDEAASSFCIIVRSCRISELKSPLPLPVSEASTLLLSDVDDVESVEVVDDVLLESVVADVLLSWLKRAASSELVLLDDPMPLMDIDSLLPFRFYRLPKEASPMPFPHPRRTPQNRFKDLLPSPGFATLPADFAAGRRSLPRRLVHSTNAVTYCHE